MINNKYIVVVDDNGDVYKLTEKIFKTEKSFEFIQVNSERKNIKTALDDIPDLIIINEEKLSNDIFDVCQYIRKDKDNSITPIIVVSKSREEDFRIDVLQSDVEYYIAKPLNEKYFYHTIKNICRLISSNRCISALTGLPGNVQIEAELKRRIASKKTYAVLYFDLDNFKSFNDKYGFMNGDEVIKFTSATIQEAVQEFGLRGDFVGHVGGDDFVAVVDYENSKKIARTVLKKFDKGILSFYTEDDIKHGGIRMENRRGKLEKFPIMTLTAAMISNRYKKYKSTLEIGEEGASVKKKAKAIEGSTFLENRRKS